MSTTAGRSGRSHDGFYVVHESSPRPPGTIVAGDGRVLGWRRHGYEARLCVADESGASLPVATLLRAAAAAGRALEAAGDPLRRPLRVRLGPPGCRPRLTSARGADQANPGRLDLDTLELDGREVAAACSHHVVDGWVAEVIGAAPPVREELGWPSFPSVPVRVLLFESVMASELPHNEQEISQGVLHILGALRGTAVTACLVELKMPAGDPAGPLRGLGELARAVASGPIQLVCLTLLEDYFDGACRLLAELRRLGCRAHVAVGGVMPTLTPEHVAAHLPEVSFVCRGAGEYFVPRLAEIVAPSDVTVPFSDEQCRALMAMDGLLAIDRAGGRLVAGNPARVVEVPDLDAVALDLSYLARRHVEGGIEIATARGCLHHCAFCSIIGRGRYQARSPDAVARLLASYEARFAELYGGEVPPAAFRVHVSDDDFGCDRERAAAILARLGRTRFRLSSLQLSIADLCQRRGRHLEAAPEERLLTALAPERFADHGRAIGEAARLADYGSRHWSSYLQIGVESFCDRELVRLGKGYRVAHVRAVFAALAARGLHVDAYLILSNSDTSADDLRASVEELCRLKLRYGRHFHLRYPAVPHLVSYFPSRSYQRKMRTGRTGTLALRRLAARPPHGEFDYPFVDHDVPQDDWVRYAVERGFLTDGQRYTQSLGALRERWLERLRSLPPGADRREGERLVRQLDDAPRRLVFELLREVRERRRAAAAGGGAGPESRALAIARELLGPPQAWQRALGRFLHEVAPRLVVIPTWQCELRCRYCYVAKQEGRSMDPRILERAVDLLLSSTRPRLLLQFFGGEPLCRYDLVQHGIEYATRAAARLGREIGFLVSSNGYSLDEDKLGWLARHPVRLELSLDGAPETHNAYRPAKDPTVDSYGQGIPARLDALHAAGLAYEVIMVVHPDNVDRLAANFLHIADLGCRRIQLNFGLGARWSEAEVRAFADGLHRVGEELRRRWQRGDPVVMVNLEHRPLPMRLNGEITVDYDGTIYGGNAFLHESPHKHRFVLGHLDDLVSFDRYWLDAPSNDFLLAWTYPPDVTANNLAVGRILSSFVAWMRGEPRAQ